MVFVNVFLAPELCCFTLQSYKEFHCFIFSLFYFKVEYSGEIQNSKPVYLFCSPWYSDVYFERNLLMIFSNYKIMKGNSYPALVIVLHVSPFKQ